MKRAVYWLVERRQVADLAVKLGETERALHACYALLKTRDLELARSHQTQTALRADRIELRRRVARLEEQWAVELAEAIKEIAA